MAWSPELTNKIELGRREAIARGVPEATVNSYIQSKYGPQTTGFQSQAKRPQGIIASIANPFVKTAQQALGYTYELGRAGLSKLGYDPYIEKGGKYRENPFLREDELSRKSILKGMANPAAVIATVGTGGAAAAPLTAGKLALQGATAAGLSEAGMEGSTVGSTATAAATGGLTAGLLTKLGPSISKVLGKGRTLRVPRSVAKTGEILEDRALTRSWGIKPTMEGGKTFMKSLKDIGILDPDLDKMATKASTILQNDGNTLEQAVTGIRTPINASAVIKELKSKISSNLTAEAREPFEAVLESVTPILNRKDMTLSNLLKIRREYGKLFTQMIKGKKGGDLSTGEAWRTVYNKINDVIDDSLKVNGMSEFRALNKRISTAEKALSFIDRASKVIPNASTNITSDLITGGASAVAAGNPLAAIPAVMAKRTMANPSTQGFIGRTMQRIGGKGIDIPNIKLPNVGNRGAMVASTLAGRASTMQPQTQESQLLTPSTMTQQVPTQTQGIDIGGVRYTPEMIQRAMIYDLTMTGGKNQAKLQNILDVMQQIQKMQGGTTSSGVGKAAAKDVATARSGMTSLSQVESLMSTGKLFAKSLPGSFGARDLSAAEKNVLDAIARLRTGAAMTKNEEAFYRGFLPSVLDSEQVRRQKIEQLRSYFSDFANAEASVGITADSLVK